MKWLSRGLFEALVQFIGRASSKSYKLRGMFYEFRYPPIGKAFSEARKAGADVAIRYEAQTYKKANEAMISKAGIKGICKPQKPRAGIRHNKFIVLIHNDEPIAVGQARPIFPPAGFSVIPMSDTRFGQGYRAALSRLLGASCGIRRYEKAAG